MRLSRKIDQALGFVMAISLIVIFGVLIGLTARNTFAEGDGTQDSYSIEGAKFVTFYDDGQKLTVKTDAKTVKEAIERAGIVMNDGDIVEPGLETEINADNFFINIYRARPVVVEDGKISDACFDGTACTISTSSTDIMCELLKDKDIQDNMIGMV